MKYGNLEIDDSTLMTSSANNVQNYVQSLPWSNKRKEKFMNAYQKLAEAGITGATSDTGQWQILTERDVNLEGMDKKDLEMLGEAAHFYRLLMESLAEDAKSAEEEKKEEKKDKKAYSYQDFNSNLIQTIFNRYGGGRSDLGTKIWNEKDLRGENGLRGHTERAKELATILQDYSNNLKDDDFDFTNSPFRDINDFRGRIAEAIQALNTETDRNVLQLKLAPLGINVEDFFNNGSGDLSDKKKADGTPFTYGELLELNEQEARKKAAELEKLKLANRGVMLSVNGIHGTDAATNPQAYEEYIRGKIGLGQAGYNQMNQLVLNLLNKAATSGLNSLEKQQLGNFLYYIRTKNPNYNQLVNGKTNITDEEWAELKTHPKLGQFTNKGDYIRLPWNTSDGKYTYADNKGNLYFVKPANKKKFAAPIRSANYYSYRNNFLKGKPEQRNAYLLSKKDGLTSAEWEELASIGFDIASIVDPEMISAAGLALTGSGLRHHAALNQPGGMSTSDKWWLAADYGLSILGSIPVLGDSALAYRAINNLKKAIVPLGIVMAGANVPQAAKAAYNKVVNGLDLTILDWRAIGGVLTAAVGMGRGRQMAKRAEALRRTGGSSQKTITEGTVKTDKGEIKGLSEKTTKELQKSFKKAGNDNEAKTKALRENAEVQTKAKELGIKLEEASITSESSWRNKAPSWMRSKKQPEITTGTRTESTGGNRVATLRAMAEFNKNHGWLARKGLAEQDWVFRHTGGYESTPTSNWFKDTWNNLRKSKWDEFGNKNNPTPTATTATTTPTATNTSPQLQNQGINIPAGRFDDRSMVREELLNKAIINRYKNILSGNVSNNPVKEGKYKFDNMNVEVKKTPTGTYDIFINGKRTDSIKDLTSTELKKHIASLVKEHRSSVNRGKSKSEKVSTKEIGKILLDLKKKGWLKQGGKITDTHIDNFLKQYKW